VQNEQQKTDNDSCVGVIGRSL